MTTIGILIDDQVSCGTCLIRSFGLVKAQGIWEGSDFSAINREYDLIEGASDRLCDQCGSALAPMDLLDPYADQQVRWIEGDSNPELYGSWYGCRVGATFCLSELIAMADACGEYGFMIIDHEVDYAETQDDALIARAISDGDPEHLAAMKAHPFHAAVALASYGGHQIESRRFKSKPTQDWIDDALDADPDLSQDDLEEEWERTILFQEALRYIGVE